MKQPHDRPLPRYSRGYSVIVFAPNNDGDLMEVQRIKRRSLNDAGKEFDSTVTNMKWSLKARTDLGIPKDAPIILQLFDHLERFPLKEECVLGNGG